MKTFHALKFRLPFLMIILLVIPLTILGIISYQKTKVLEHVVIQKEDMEALSNKFKKIFLEHEMLIKNFSDQPELQYPTYTFTNKVDKTVDNMPLVNDQIKLSFYEDFFKKFEEKQKYLLNTYLATENGEFYLSNIPPSEVNLQQFDPREREWYLQAKKENGAIIWTKPYIDTGTGKSTITLAKALKDEKSQIIGVVGFDFDMHQLAVLMREGLRNISLIIAALSLVIGIIIVSIFVSKFNRTLNLLQVEMAKVAEGNLSIGILEDKRKDELGMVLTSFNQMVSNLKQLVSKVVHTSQHIANSSEQLNVNADETSKASEQIAGSIQEVSSGAELQLEKVTHSTKIVSQILDDIQEISIKADNVAQSSKGTSEQAHSGSMIVQNAIEQMNIITIKTEQSAEIISLLNQKSTEIEEIITLITNIADQTNLLALNAAIEAARAGEHGKGFAVVADEVRKLAEQSGKSTQKIGMLIKEIQSNTNKAVDSMKEGEAAVKEGTTLVSNAGSSFTCITNAVNDISNQMREVSTSIEHIHHHTGALVTSIKQVSEITEQTTAYTQEVATATEEQTASMQEVSAATKMLAITAEELQMLANKFEI